MIALAPLLAACLALAGDDTGYLLEEPAELPEDFTTEEEDSQELGGSVGFGGGGSAAGFGGGGSLSMYRGPPPREPTRAPTGDAVDAQGVPLPELAHTRLGSSAWQPGGPVEALAVFGDRALLGGSFGVVEVDDKGVIVAKHAERSGRSVAFRPDGIATWTSHYGGGLELAGAPSLRAPCYSPETWSIAFIDADTPLWACDDGLHIGSEEGSLVEGTTSLDTFVVSADRIFGWNTLDPGTWDIDTSKRKPKVVATTEHIFDAAFSASGRLAIATEEGVSVDGKPLKGVGRSIEVAWHADNERVAINTVNTLIVHNGKKPTCELTLPRNMVGDVAWLGDTVLLASRDRSALLRVDAASCAFFEETSVEPPLALRSHKGQLWTAGATKAQAWNPQTGTLLAVHPTSVEGHALAARSDGLWLVSGSKGRRGSLAVDGYKPLPVDNSGYTEIPEMRYLSLDMYGPHWQIPSDPVAASSAAGHIAWGHEALFVELPSGAVREYVLHDQVDPGVKGPRTGGMFGMAYGMGMDTQEREVSAGWDPKAVRPRDLTLVDLDWSSDGKRLAMLWTFLVTDPYGEDEQNSWLGILEPHRSGLAGISISGLPEQVVLSGDGNTVAVRHDHRVDVHRIAPPEGWEPPEPEPEPEPEPAPASDVPPRPQSDADLAAARATEDALAQLDGLLLQMLSEPLSDEMWGGSGALGLGGDFDMDDGDGYGSAPVHHGDAQRLNLRSVGGYFDLRGTRAAMALSHDGSHIAIGSDLETGLWALDKLDDSAEDDNNSDPIWRHDLGQQGTSALFVDGDTLWVAGKDGTVLGVELPSAD